MFFPKELFLASEWASKLGGEEEVERAAVSGLQPKKSRARARPRGPRVFILTGANQGELTLKAGLRGKSWKRMSV